MSEPGPAPSRPDPPSRPAARVHPLTPFVKGWVFFLFGAWAIVQNEGLRSQLRLAAVGLLAVFAGGVLLGGLSWWFTKYQLTGDALRVDSGFLFRRTRIIRFDRIQAIDVAQPVVPRIFGMAELRMEVAGGSSSDGRLSYLTLDQARQLRNTLLSATAAEQPGERSGESEPAAAVDLPPILTVPTTRLLGATLLSSTVIGSVGGLVWLLAATTLLNYRIGMFAAIPLLLGVFQPIWKQVIGNHGFTLSESAGGLRTKRGLFDLQRQTVPPGRVQGLLVSEPLLWRRLDWAKVELDIAGVVGSADGDELATGTQLLPVGTGWEVAGVLNRVVPGLDLSRIEMRRAPERVRWLRPVGWRYLAYGADERVLVTVQGWIHRRTSIVLHHKTQSVRLTQGPLQRRLRLANVHVDTPAGPVNAVALHRDVEDAAQLLETQSERARRARRLG